MSNATLQKIVPVLQVKNVKETVEFYCNKLGFGHKWFYGEPAEEGGCRRDDVHIMFMQDENISTGVINLLFFIHHIEKLYDEFADNNVSITKPLQQFENGLREFAITDCNNYTLRFAENHH